MLLFGNTKGSLGLIFTPKLFVELQFCHVRPPLWRSMNTNDGKRENASLLLLFSTILKITPNHINKNRELKQRGRERQRERHKTIDLITEYNHFMWECNHLAHRSPENKRNVGICWAKSLTGFKLDATYANSMQHSPTWCTNGRNMLQGP